MSYLQCKEKEMLEDKWGDCVILHNRPFYSIYIEEDKKVKKIKTFKSYYDLSKPYDGEIKSEAVN